jgi:hypothetical protein
MKLLLLIVFLFLSFIGFSQHEPDSERIIQFSIVPAFYYNTATLGYGVKKQNKENIIEVHSTFILPAAVRMFSVGVTYNRNYYLKNSNTYIPLWSDLQRINVNNNFEDGGPKYDKFNFSLGSGIGTHFNVFKVHKFRFELGLGAVFRSENKSSFKNESALPMYLGLDKFTIAESYLVLPTFRMKFRYLFPLN